MNLNIHSVTKLDAANHFTVSHLEDAENWKLVEKSKVLNMGYFADSLFFSVVLFVNLPSVGLSVYISFLINYLANMDTLSLY